MSDVQGRFTLVPVTVTLQCVLRPTDRYLLDRDRCHRFKGLAFSRSERHDFADSLVSVLWRFQSWREDASPQRRKACRGAAETLFEDSAPPR